MRGFTAADTEVLFDEIHRHWSKLPLLGCVPLLLSNPPPAIRAKRPQPPVPFAFLLINTAFHPAVMLTFTVWHEDDQTLRAWQQRLEELFAAEPLTVEGEQFQSRWFGNRRLLPAGPKHADSNGVMPWIMPEQCILWRPGDGSRWSRSS